MADLSPREIAALALTRLGAHFIYRKWGSVYDYWTPSDQMPSPKLPSAADIRAGLPNPFGVGSGMADCALNAALLFDGLTTRIELGVAAADDYKIHDRLIGGLIRLGTTAPQYEVIAGIGADGKSFYPQRDYSAALYWGYHAWRAISTAVIAPESQTKIRSIAEQWFNHLAAKQCEIFTGANPANSDAPWLSALIKPAIFAAGSVFTHNDKWKKLASETFDFTVKFSENPPPLALFNIQLALLMARQIFYPFPPRSLPKPKKKGETEPAQEPSPVDDYSAAIHAKIIEKMREISQLTFPRLTAFPQLDLKIIDETPSLDWREVKNLTIPWTKIIHENERIAEPLLAGLIVLWSPEFAAEKIDLPLWRALLTAPPFAKVWLAKALTPVALLHALGIERGLWENPPPENLPNDAPPSLVAKFIEPDYDAAHPLQAGHTDRAANNRKNLTANIAGSSGSDSPAGNSSPAPLSPRSGAAKSRSRHRRKR